MPELKNSKRINYKATYVNLNVSSNQLESGPNWTNNLPGQSIGRAVAKTAFAQSLNLTTTEIADLKNVAAKELGGASMTEVEFRREAKPSRRTPGGSRTITDRLPKRLRSDKVTMDSAL